MNYRLCTLCSGSDSNATLIDSGEKKILIDAGCGIRIAENLLNELHTSLSEIDAVFITHEHTDHIKGLQSITKNHKIPIIANKNTLNAIKSTFPSIDEDCMIELPTGATAVNGNLTIKSIKTNHDAVESVGYLIKTDKSTVGVFTDLGDFNSEIVDALSQCETAVLEANHDIEMLMNGPYSFPLKNRILGKNGHLSNIQCAELICKATEGKMKNVILAHLSAENNTPPLAYATISDRIESKGKKVFSCQCDDGLFLSVAPRRGLSAIIEG